MKNGIETCTPMCYLPSGKLVCYQKGYVLIFEGEFVVKKIIVFNNKKEYLFGRYRYLYRL